MSWYTLKDGTPVAVSDAVEWARSYKLSADDRRVALDEIGEITISTVFLGIDHSFGLDGPPVLWETMIFVSGSRCEDLDQWCDRYTSREDAKRGHAAAVAMVRGRLEEC